MNIYKYIWNKKTHPVFQADYMRDKRFYKLRDWIAETVKTTWHVEKWNNVDQDGSDINNKPFGNTKLKKGLFGPFYTIGTINDNLTLTYCYKMPYSPYDKSIEIPIGRDLLESLCRNDVKKFKSVYRYYDGW